MRQALPTAEDTEVILEAFSEIRDVIQEVPGNEARQLIRQVTLIYLLEIGAENMVFEKCESDGALEVLRGAKRMAMDLEDILEERPENVTELWGSFNESDDEDDDEPS